MSGVITLGALGGFARGVRQLGADDDVQVGQRAPALVEAEPVACEELVRNREADVPKRNVLDEASVWTVEQRHRREARGVAKRERSTEKMQREPRVDDVLHDD